MVIVSLSQLSPNPSHLSTHSTSWTPLKNQNKQAKENNNTHKNKTLFCWPTIPGYRTCPSVWLIHPLTPLGGKNWFPFFGHVSLATTLLVRGGTPCLLPVLVPGLLSGLSL